MDEGQDSESEDIDLAARWKVDSVHTERLTRLAFGSCSKQLQPQPLWTPIAAFDPQVWLWSGDAVYAEGGVTSAVEKLRDAVRLLWPDAPSTASAPPINAHGLMSADRGPCASLHGL